MTYSNEKNNEARSMNDIREVLKNENLSFDLLEISFEKIQGIQNIPKNSDYHIIRIKARWSDSDLDPIELPYSVHRNLLRQIWESLTPPLKNEKASNNSLYSENDLCIFYTKEVIGVRNLFPYANQGVFPCREISCYRHPDKSAFYVLLIDLPQSPSSHSYPEPYAFQISPVMLDRVYELLSQHLQLK